MGRLFDFRKGARTTADEGFGCQFGISGWALNRENNTAGSFADSNAVEQVVVTVAAHSRLATALPTDGESRLVELRIWCPGPWEAPTVGVYAISSQFSCVGFLFDTRRHRLMGPAQRRAFSFC